MAKVVFIVFFISAASARHMFNLDTYLVNPLNTEIVTSARNDQLVQRRNIQYDSGVNTFPHNHGQSYNYYVPDHSTVRNQEKIYADNYNYIGNGNEHRLRISSHQPEGRKLEHANVDSAFTNVNTKTVNHDRKEAGRSPTAHSVILPTKYEGTLKTNINNMNQLGNVSSYIETTANSSTAHVHQEAQPPEAAGRRAETPKDDENETWVWGMEATTKYLPDDGLDDRVALVGDRCPTGFAKISGKCVIKQ